MGLKNNNSDELNVMNNVYDTSKTQSKNGLVVDVQVDSFLGCHKAEIKIKELNKMKTIKGSSPLHGAQGES